MPDKYILKRWRKDVKVSNVNISRLASEDKMATSTRHRELLHDATKFITKAATTQEAYVLAMKLIKNAVEKIEHLQVHPTSTSTFQPVPPQDIGAEPKGDSMEIHILDVDKNIQHTASVPKKNSNKQYIGKSKMKGAKRKEKGLKGEKRKLSALEKAINKRQSSIVGPPMDSESASLNPMNSTPLSDHLSQTVLTTLPMEQSSGNQHTDLLMYQHMLAYQMNPCMNQASFTFGMPPLVTENIVQMRTCSKSNGIECTRGDEGR